MASLLGKALSINKRSTIEYLLARHKIVQGRQLVTLLATQNTCSWEELKKILISNDFGQIKALIEKSLLDIPTYKTLARTLYRHSQNNDETLARLILLSLDADVLDQDDYELIISTLLGQKQFSEAKSFLPYIEGSKNYPYWKANSINPFNNKSNNFDEWLKYINMPLVGESLAPITIQNTEEDILSAIKCKAPVGSIKGPLISVIMPHYNGGPLTDASIQSILNQTWANLELIISDDGSTSQDAINRLERWQSLDSRVRLLRNEKNLGTYTARNRALKIAKGEFVTCQDCDDWAHPQRLERQAKHLVNNSSQIANLTQWVRIDEKFNFVHCTTNIKDLLHTTLVTTMFRRAPVLQRVGYWDPIRKSADREYKDRIKVAFRQQEVLITPNAPLTYSISRIDSLSNQDVYRGYFSPDRHLYNVEKNRWHKKILDGHASPFLPIRTKIRAFTAPKNLLPIKAQPASYDCILAANFFTGNEALADKLEKLVESGKYGKVALLYLPDLTKLEQPSLNLHPRIDRLILDGRICFTSLQETANCKKLIIDDPFLLLYPPAITSKIRVESMLCKKQSSSRQLGPVHLEIQLDQINQNAKSIFSQNITWEN